jgi:hypothetical protein
LDDFQEQGEFIYEYAYIKPERFEANERRGLGKRGLRSYGLFFGHKFYHRKECLLWLILVP